jgi:DNA-3-methyladenine glycosylase II
MNRAYLTNDALARGVRQLCKIDTDLEGIVRDFGPPPMWAREEGFHTLIHIILEQQVSLASARAAYDRLLEIASPLTPASFLELDDATLKRAGFSRQKTAYGRNLAQAIVENRLNLDGLNSMNDTDVALELMKIKGIGRWTSDIYLLMVLRRPDVWPSGDLALAVAVQKLKRLTYRPTNEELMAISNSWQPWRAVAARLLWHYYLSSRR